MIPPVTILATFISQDPTTYTFTVGVDTYQIPHREIWDAWETIPQPHPRGGEHYIRGDKLPDSDDLYPFAPNTVYHVLVDGWWLSDHDLWEKFREARV